MSPRPVGAARPTCNVRPPSRARGRGGRPASRVPRVTETRKRRQNLRRRVEVLRLVPATSPRPGRYFGSRDASRARRRSLDAAETRERGHARSFRAGVKLSGSCPALATAFYRVSNRSAAIARLGGPRTPRGSFETVGAKSVCERFVWPRKLNSGARGSGASKRYTFWFARLGK